MRDAIQWEQFPIPAGAEIHALHLCLLCLSVCKPPIYSPALAVPNLPAAPPTHLAHSPFGECKSVYCVQILYSLNLHNHFCYLLLLCASTPLPCTPEQQYAALHTLLQYCSGSHIVCTAAWAGKCCLGVWAMPLCTCHFSDCCSVVDVVIWLMTSGWSGLEGLEGAVWMS